MSGRRRQSLSPSLFPFLAVLVCTLGTLILFLALVAQNATKAAEQTARAEQMARAKLQAPEESPKTPRLSAKAVESMVEEEHFRVQQLVAFRDKQTADMENRRDQLTHLEDHLQRLRQKLNQLSQEVDRAMSDETLENVSEETIEEIHELIAAQKETIEKLRRENEDKTPRVVIVPHKGPNGTDRRPVYLECTEQGVTIWPEGSNIPISQLTDTRYSANPLDAALRVIRLHAMQNYGDTTPPYPLLVVRPDGIESYAAARRAMRDWDDQFGYELVPSDVKLAFAQPDGNLKKRVDYAIREAAAKQHAHYALARRGLGYGGTHLNGHPDGSAVGGAMSPGGASRSGQSRLPTLSAAELDSAARSSGFGSLREPNHGRRSNYAGSSPYTSGYGTRSAPYGSGVAGTGTADEATAAARRWAEEMQTAARELREAQGGSESPNSLGMPGTNSASSETESLGESQRAKTNPYMADPNAAGKPGGSQDGEGPLRGTGDQNRVAGRDDATLGGDEGSRSASSGDPGTSDPSAGRESAESGGRESNAAAADGDGTGESQQRQSNAVTMTMPQNGPSSFSLAQQNQANAPQMSYDAAKASQMVRRQGRDWALPPNMAGIHGNAIIRTIRVECHADRFVLLASSAGGATEVFGLHNGDVENATMRLATAVRDRIERWGPALTGGRWEPRLDVIVMPDGQTRFHQLRTLMQGSGIEVIGRGSP